MVLGNTGDGKTTLLSSIIFGAQCLQEQTITIEIPKRMKNGEFTTRKVKKLVIDHKKAQPNFDIGHS